MSSHLPCLWNHISFVFMLSIRKIFYYETAPAKQLSQRCFRSYQNHYNGVIMNAMASLITNVSIVWSTVRSGADQWKHQFPRHWPLCGEFTGGRWIPCTKGQLRGKCFHLMTAIMHVSSALHTLCFVWFCCGHIISSCGYGYWIYLYSLTILHWHCCNTGTMTAPAPVK